MVSPSVKAYALLVLILAMLSAIAVFLPQDYGPYEYPASKPVVAIVIALGMIVIYGGLGYLGLLVSRRLGFADLWDAKHSNRLRLLIPMIIGVGCGLILIVIDLVFMNFNTVGRIPHPSFPMSLVASFTAGIGEEILFRLFFISFWMWLIARVIFKRWREQVFWIVTGFSALAFSAAHFPAVMALFGYTSFSQIPAVLVAEIVIINSAISFPAAYYFRKYGFIAAVGIHFWADIVWHVIYGTII